ncbi:cysteine--tRNA ligase [Candidatus Micrarchaeota archaeon]|nr:cysteine--tRNA ligase [Candidatus Micrarchaeota archaeon]
MQFYNSLSKQKDVFEPLTKEKVLMYVCGLTPYDHAHIGHARTYVAFDMLKRYLLSKGYSIFHIQNITDVDDKIIRRAKESKKNPKELTERYQGEATELLRLLHVIDADVYPKVTESIPDIIDMIETIMKNGYAYETETGVYFEVRKFKEYGKLSGQKLDEIIAGSRKEVDETKKHPEDFALWKKTKGEILEFDSPWGKGRPGWHIECSAMSRKYAKTLDIHGGARDLIFPHHENEIAQSEAAGADPFVKYWLHTGFLTVNGEKMSKSLGNFVTLKDVLAEHSPNAVRMFFSLAHYRSPIDYNPDQIRQAEATVARMLNFMQNLDHALKKRPKKEKKDEGLEKEITKKFGHVDEFLENDLDVANALAYVFSIIKSMNTHLEEAKEYDYSVLEFAKKNMDRVLYIIGIVPAEKKLDEKLDELRKEFKEIKGVNEMGAEEIMEHIVSIREEARKKKDFKTSDEIRAKLKKIGISLEDSAETKWKIN